MFSQRALDASSTFGSSSTKSTRSLMRPSLTRACSQSSESSSANHCGSGSRARGSRATPAPWRVPQARAMAHHACAPIGWRCESVSSNRTGPARGPGAWCNTDSLDDLASESPQAEQVCADFRVMCLHVRASRGYLLHLSGRGAPRVANTTLPTSCNMPPERPPRLSIPRKFLMERDVRAPSPSQAMFPQRFEAEAVNAVRDAALEQAVAQHQCTQRVQPK